MRALAAALVDISWSEVAAIFTTIVTARLYVAVGEARLALWMAHHPGDATDLRRDLNAGRPRARRHARRVIALWPFLLPRVRPLPSDQRPPRRAYHHDPQE